MLERDFITMLEHSPHVMGIQEPLWKHLYFQASGGCERADNVINNTAA